MAELHACFHLSQRRQVARDDAVFNELIARLDEEETTPMAETNEYELQALWWKRVLSAFTKRHDRQEIPYVLELLRCVGDQRATETAHRAWLLTRRDRADAIAEIRIRVAHAEELAEL